MPLWFELKWLKRDRMNHMCYPEASSLIYARTETEQKEIVINKGSGRIFSLEKKKSITETNFRSHNGISIAPCRREQKIYQLTA